MKISLVRVLEFPESKSDHPRDIIPSFELATVATLLKAQHTVLFFDNEVHQMQKEETIEILTLQSPDVVVIHFDPVVAKQIKEVVNSLKRKNKELLVIGIGPYIDHVYKEYLKKSKIDIVALSEPEMAIIDIVKALSDNKKLSFAEKEKINGIAFVQGDTVITTKRRAYVNPNTLPFLSHEFLSSEKYGIVSKSLVTRGKTKWGFLLSSRGCPYPCTFCAPSIRNSVGKAYRHQSPTRTADELEYMVKYFGINAVSFEDDIFTLDRKRVMELCDEIIRRKLKIKWTVATRADRLDLELAQKMKQAGCAGISLGVESGSDKVLKEIKKSENTKTILKGISILHEAGIAPTTNLIVGHPNESLEDIEQTIRFARKLKPIYIHVHYFTPYPGTKYYEENKKKLGLYYQFSHRKIHDFNISQIPDKQLKKMMSRLYMSYYLSLKYIPVYLKYRLEMIVFHPVRECAFLLKNFMYVISKKDTK